MLGWLNPFGGNSAAEQRILEQVASGGARFQAVAFTRNRRVMASLGDRGRTLRLHESFREAPPDVLRALGTLFSSRGARGRARARSVVRAYVSETAALRPAERPPRRHPSPSPSDSRHIQRLQQEFDAVNRSHFGGRLPRVSIRLSGRMRRRNGHFSSDPLEIAISRTLCVRAVEGEAERTLRHEMIHLWQWIEGGKPGHGQDFRRWARRLEIQPRATRTVEMLDC